VPIHAHPPSARFSCHSERRGDKHVVVIAGELDLSTAPAVQAEFRAIAARATDILVDLGALEFMDSTGLHAMLSLDAESRRDGFTVTFRRGCCAVKRLFELTGTDARLAFVD
jgi:anti-sigma B factor antagonist